MKSKKGFSLVELMIVVVIMAILVAVAVPIYNSVTGNARQKTCIDNQRQIMSTVGNALMMGGVTDVADNTQFTVTNPEGDDEPEMVKGSYNITATGADWDTIKGSFKTVPCCGQEGGTITVKIVDGVNGGSATAEVSCDQDGHKLDTLNS
ncbi:MAG: prepilin-type N-terminal cleavage/methylation domain-containing protein [Clostridia bacterium]|nr:prepilin-type N-terminal cleavage/methylation domain-containing protein [Clostridia bacterium]